MNLARCILKHSFFFSDVMALPALRRCIYGFCAHKLNASMEALMNIMQAIFLVLRSIPALDVDMLPNAHQIFSSLYAQYFETEMVIIINFKRCVQHYNIYT